jgi:hypothetical protein
MARRQIRSRLDLLKVTLRAGLALFCVLRVLLVQEYARYSGGASSCAAHSCHARLGLIYLPLALLRADILVSRSL